MSVAEADVDVFFARFGSEASCGVQWVARDAECANQVVSASAGQRGHNRPRLVRPFEGSREDAVAGEHGDDLVAFAPAQNVGCMLGRVSPLHSDVPTACFKRAANLRRACERSAAVGRGIDDEEKTGHRDSWCGGSGAVFRGPGRRSHEVKQSYGIREGAFHWAARAARDARDARASRAARDARDARASRARCVRSLQSKNRDTHED